MPWSAVPCRRHSHRSRARGRGGRPGPSRDRPALTVPGVEGVPPGPAGLLPQRRRPRPGQLAPPRPAAPPRPLLPALHTSEASRLELVRAERPRRRAARRELACDRARFPRNGPQLRPQVFDEIPHAVGCGQCVSKLVRSRQRKSGACSQNACRSRNEQFPPPRLRVVVACHVSSLVTVCEENARACSRDTRRTTHRDVAPRAVTLRRR